MRLLTFCFYSNIVSNTVKSGKFVILLAFNNFLYKILFRYIPHEKKNLAFKMLKGLILAQKIIELTVFYLTREIFSEKLVSISYH